jgi:acyl carrier protein
MEDQIASFIATEILKDPDRQIGDNEPIISSGLIDSFNLVDLALYVEETFLVRIDDAELTSDTFDSVAELVALIQARQNS